MEQPVTVESSQRQAIRILVVEDDPHDAEPSPSEAAQRFRTTFDHAAIGIAHVSHQDGRFQLVNPKLCELLGYRREELVGRTVFEMSHPEDREVTREARAQLLAGKRNSFSATKRYLRKDGTPLWVDLTVSLVRNVDGAPRFEIAMFEDITARKEAERAVERLGRMYAALSAANEAVVRIKDERALYQRICDIAVEHGGIKLAAVRLVDSETGWIRPAAIAGEPAAYLNRAVVSVDRGIAEGQGPATDAVLEERTVVVNDCFSYPKLRPWWQLARQSGIAADAGIPLRRGGQVVGLLSLFAGELGWFDGALVRLAERMAESLSLALDGIDANKRRRKAKRRLEESEARFRSLTELSSDMFWEQDDQYRFTEQAGKFPEWAGDSRARLMGKRRWDLHFVNMSEADWAVHRAQLEARRPFQDLELCRLDESGKNVWVSVSGEPVFDESGAFKGYRGVGKEITPRKLAQLRVARLKAMYAALSAVNEAILRAATPEELYRRACEIAVENGGFSLGTVLLHDPATGDLKRVASAGRSPEFVGQLTATLDASRPEGRGLLGEVLRTGNPAISNALRSDARAGPLQALALEHSIGSAATYPLLLEGRVIGVFGLLHGEAGAFDDEMLALVRRLADNISFALENFEREQRRRNSEQAMRESEERFRSLTELNSDMYWEQDGQYRFVALWGKSPAWLERGRRQMLGKCRWDQNYLNMTAANWAAHKADLDARRLFHDLELCRINEAGEHVWVNVSGEPVFNDEGDFKGYRGVGKDITERKRADQALRASEERFRSLTELSSDWYWEQDEELRLSFHSSGFARSSGTTSPKLLGKRRWEEPNRFPLSCTWDEHRATLEARKPFQDFEYVRIGDDGKRYFVSLSGVPIFDATGNFKGYRGVGKNITERKHAEEQLRRFRLAMDNSADMIVLIDRATMRYVDVNGTICKLLGYSRKELLSMGPQDLLAVSREELESSYDDLIANPSSVNELKSCFRCKDGSLLPFESTRHVLRSGDTWIIAAIARDVRERLRNEERLQHSIERFEIVARATNDVVWDWNLLTDEVWWNDSLKTAFGWAPLDVGAYNDSWTSRIHPEDLEAVKSSVQEAIDGGERSWSREYRFQRKNGSYATVHDRGLLLHDAAGRPVRMIGAMVDISKRKRSERRLARHARRQEGVARLGEFALGKAVLEAVFAEAVRVLRAGGCDVAVLIEQLSAEGEFLVRAASGEGAEASVGRQGVASPDAMWRIAVTGSRTVVADRAYFASRPADMPWPWLRGMGSGAYAVVQGENGPFGALCMNSLRENAFGEEDLRFVEAVANVLSATLRRHQAESRLAYLAQFDALTGLPNRNLLQDRLAQSIARARRQDWHGAVLFIDLDRFKLVNDTLGHHAGDGMIGEVGKRLQGCVRGGDTVGRMSGDEFAVVLTDLAQGDDAAVVARKILDVLAQPFDLGGTEACVTASIGISIFLEDGEDPDTLLKNADMAMYQAKESGRNAYRFFTAQMNTRSVAKLQLNNDLRRALERGEFTLHYQPKVDLQGSRLVGVEALLRWNHPGRGMVQPGEFIPALEESGLILQVGEWVIAEACAQLRRWRLEGLELVPIAVNLSAKQFQRQDLDAVVRRALADAGVSADLLELEITESCLMQDPEEAVRALERLRAAGISISVDDFGTGYSSLSYLTRLPITTLKVDRSFVRDADSSEQSASIVRAIIDMAHNMKFTVIAEGVETEAQAAFLRRHGCDLAQGYLIGRPVPAGEIAARPGTKSRVQDSPVSRRPAGASEIHASNSV